MTSAQAPRRALTAHQAGAATIELVLLAPVLIMITMLMIALGRAVQAQLRVDDAAYQAARAASEQASPLAAQQHATATARTALRAAGTSCAALTVSIDTAEMRPGGAVTVSLTCSISTSGLSDLRLSGTVRATASATAPIDTYAAGAAS